MGRGVFLTLACFEFASGQSIPMRRYESLSAAVRTLTLVLMTFLGDSVARNDPSIGRSYQLDA